MVSLSILSLSSHLTFLLIKNPMKMIPLWSKALMISIILYELLYEFKRQMICQSSTNK